MFSLSLFAIFNKYNYILLTNSIQLSIFVNISLFKMAAREASKCATKIVRPLLSSDKSEAKKRVLNLYKTYYRQIPLMLFDRHLPVSKEECQIKLKEEFLKNKHITDVRVIDMLVIKGQMLLQEIVTKWAQDCHVMSLFKDTVEPKPNDFLSKFVNNNDSQ